MKKMEEKIDFNWKHDRATDGKLWVTTYSKKGENARLMTSCSKGKLRVVWFHFFTGNNHEISYKIANHPLHRTTRAFNKQTCCLGKTTEEEQLQQQSWHTQLPLY